MEAFQYTKGRNNPLCTDLGTQVWKQLVKVTQKLYFYKCFKAKQFRVYLENSLDKSKKVEKPTQKCKTSQIPTISTLSPKENTSNIS